MWKWEAEGKATAAVVLLHSAYEHHGRHAWLIERFRTAGMHVIAGDLPGHGKQGAEVHDEGFHEYRRYAKELIRTGMAEDLPLFVLGHGLGGVLAADMARNDSLACAGLILTSPWFRLKHLPPRMKGPLSGLGKIAGGIKFNHQISEDMLTGNQDPVMADSENLYHPVATAAWYRELNSYIKEISESVPKPGSPPVLLHAAGHDELADSDAMHAWLTMKGREEFQYKQWKNARHDIFREQEQEEVFLYTESFIRGVLRSLGYIA
ncbi:hypothetical protein AV656_00190 [Bhargavaea cecembensis]|uniref:Serine aminopeptidase S33 domain-containing protein n=1 Tax=Bhargavaea cecembensis TaxID=394098 RepID=A0A161RHZ4_9BACL|nr:alpha/beta hydrolase [Bhargavaea cecembensis]KZE39752.1 hypothetical protein AV656_00190 [Bhargavaea cecembensis]